jgi:protein-tyrosine phosphatase
MDRLIALEGCLNFRDLGGYPTADGRLVRWRRVFRSDALHLLSAPDVRRLRDEIGLGEIIDLRSTSEVRADGRGPLADEPVRFHHLPLFDGVVPQGAEQPADMNLAERYFLLAEFARAPIGRLLTTLAESTTPAVYHCAAGKDRTGVVSAILLGLLGVDPQIIVADYALTQENLDAIIARLLATDGYRSMLAALPPETMHANPETMEGFLLRLQDKYGSAVEYARAAGIGADTLRLLRERLLE